MILVNNRSQFLSGLNYATVFLYFKTSKSYLCNRLQTIVKTITKVVITLFTKVAASFKKIKIVLFLFPVNFSLLRKNSPSQDFKTSGIEGKIMLFLVSLGLTGDF